MSVPNTNTEGGKKKDEYTCSEKDDILIELTHKQPLQWRRSSVVETALVSDLDSAPNEMLHLGLVI